MANELGLVIEDGILKTIKDKTQETVIVPEGVTQIGDRAFSGCKNLTDIVLPDWLREKTKKTSTKLLAINSNRPHSTHLTLF